MKKNLTKLAIGSLNLISLVFTGQSLEAGTEEGNLKAKLHDTAIELEAILKTLLLPESEFNLRGKHIFISDKAFEVVNKHPIAKATWQKFVRLIGRLDKFYGGPPQKKDSYYLQGYNEQKICNK